MIKNFRKIIRKFYKAELRESCAALGNPGCGWYHMYTFRAEKPEKEFYLVCEEEELVLLLIDIGWFRETELSQEALQYIADILTFFRSRGKEMILRFAYDTEGNGMLKDPAAGNLIKTHMRQLGSVLLPFAEDIVVLQGILVGSWGEMHDSRFVSDRWITELSQTMLEAVKYQCSLAVRTPAQWRTIAKNSPEKVKEKLALFNDGIFGTETDMGTYDIGAGDGREEELRWQRETVKFQRNGGEVLGIKDCRRAAEDMAKMHLSYLNSAYDPIVLDRWRSEKVEWEGCGREVSAYDYIGNHLGYRFVVRDVVFRRGALRITVENCGFANLCESAECRVLLQTSGGELIYFYPDTDPQSWESRKSITFSVSPDLAGMENGTKYYVELRRKRDGRILSFANAGGEKQLLIGQFGNPGSS